MRLERFNKPIENIDLDLHFCGYEDVVPNFATPPHIRKRYVIHYIIKGTGFYYVDNRKLAIGPGDIFVIYPGTLVSYATQPEDPWSFCWFSFHGTRAIEMLERIGLDPSTPVQHIMANNQVPSLISKFIQVMDTNRSSTRLQGILYLLFAELEESYLQSGKQPTSASKSLEHVEKAVIYIENNYFNPVTVTNMAKYVGLERTYFSKIFRQHTGKSPQDYLIHYRIDKSMQMIKLTNLPLNEICRYVGFDETYYFSRMFKKVVGISPSQYRNEHAHFAELNNK